MPYYLLTDECFRFALDDVFQTPQNYQLTLEFASNPVWNALQALPVVEQPLSNNAVTWFALHTAGIRIIVKQ